jgi:hypothetical protein
MNYVYHVLAVRLQAIHKLRMRALEHTLELQVLATVILVSRQINQSVSPSTAEPRKARRVVLVRIIKPTMPHYISLVGNDE